MKATIPIILLSFVFVSFITIGDNFRTFQDTKNGFSITYPKHWKKVSQSKKSAAKFVASHSENGRVPASVILLMWENNSEVSLDTVCYNYMKQLRKTGNSISAGGEATINGRKFYFFNALIDNPQETILSKYYVALRENKTVVVRFISNPAVRFQVYEKTFADIINSLNLQ